MEPSRTNPTRLTRSESFDECIGDAQPCRSTYYYVLFFRHSRPAMMRQSKAPPLHHHETMCPSTLPLHDQRENACQMGAKLRHEKT